MPLTPAQQGKLQGYMQHLKGDIDGAMNGRELSGAWTGSPYKDDFIACAKAVKNFQPPPHDINAIIFYEACRLAGIDPEDT